MKNLIEAREKEIRKIQNLSRRQIFWKRVLERRCCLTCYYFEHKTLTCKWKSTVDLSVLFREIPKDDFTEIGSACPHWK